jgi:signal transduction histidine kinase
LKARTYLILMALAILVPVALIIAAGLDMLLQWERTSRLRGVQETARSTALLVDREIAVAEGALRAIGSSTALRDGRLADVHRDASGMNAATPWSWTVIRDRAGSQVMNTLVPFGRALPGHGAGPAPAVSAGYPRVSGYFVGPVTRRATVSVDMLVTPAADREYIASQFIEASHFMQVFDNAAIPSSWVVTVFDADGISVARNHNAPALVGRPVGPELFKASRATPSGMLIHTTRDHVPVYSTYMRAPLSQWTVAIGVPVAEIEAGARQATVFAALAMLAVLGLAIGIAVVLGRRLKASLDQARLAAHGLARGVLPPPRSTGVREVDLLLDALHRTSTDLGLERRARQALEDQREGLLRSEREARFEAERRNGAKDTFLAMLGHELRNPLAGIAGALAVLEMPGVKPEQTTQARAIAKRQAGHLTRIVDDLLDVRRILSGKVALQRTRLDAGALLRRCCETKIVVDAGTHAWQVDAPALWVDADATRLEQMFDNVLHNAMKYTPAGGSIAVRAAAGAGGAVIEVVDSGVGIPAGTLPFIFEALVQGPTSIDRAQGGLGLGLALVKELTILHGGTIRAHSDGAGRGCTFTLTLPLAAAPEPAPA